MLNNESDKQSPLEQAFRNTVFNFVQDDNINIELDRLLQNFIEDGFFEEHLRRAHSKPSYSAPQPELNSSTTNDSSEWDFIRNLVLGFLRAGENDEITVLRERHYVDPTYRDAYYSYYSRQHFDKLRYSQRLSFFDGHIEPEDIAMGNLTQFANSLMATCVVNPLPYGAIGRTLIDPKRWFKDENIAIRCVPFEVNIFGCRFEIRAFPYRKQDRELTRCAEITLINLIDYYSNTYPEYAVAYGSQIRKIEEQYCSESGAPSRGISYSTLSRILFDSGFSPRLFNVNSLGTTACSTLQPFDRFHRLAHYYIESGIPLAVNPEPPSGQRDGHSLIVVGYGRNGRTSKKSKKEAWKKRIICNTTVSQTGDQEWVPSKSAFACNLIDSADYYSKYIVIDDNQMPYELCNFKNMTMHPGFRSSTAIAALSKSMVLDAMDAQEKIIALLSDPRQGVIHWGGKYLEDLAAKAGPDGLRVVMRVFMASAKSFKRFRIDHTKDRIRKALYANTPMPKFTWVCELYSESNYLNDGTAFAEVVLDATSDVQDFAIRNVIISNYPNVIGFSLPSKPVQLTVMYSDNTDGGIIPYDGNLQLIPDRQ